MNKIISDKFFEDLKQQDAEQKAKIATYKAQRDELLAVLKAVELGVFGSMLPNSDIAICTRATRQQVRAAIEKLNP